MSVFAIAMVKDEADVIEETVGHMLGQVDHLIVADNSSTDGTREILEGLGVEVVDDLEAGYYQSQKMTALAAKARRRGADWIIPFDADEVHLPLEGSIREVFDALPDDVLISEAPLFDHVSTGDDPPGPPVKRMGFRRAEAAPLRKIAVRAVEGVVIDQGNHSASIPGERHPKTVTNAIEVRHFPYRSVEQFVRKIRNGAAAYAATDLPEEVGGHWRQYGEILEGRGEEGIAEIFHRWFYRDDPTKEIVIGSERQPPLVFDPCLAS